ncbi:agamous-like MADS-box protein AGL80 [Cajanus cajan]|uniref:Agamous-like MADS-box protein AGL80 n=1 Tax=Cajanus cajan TaxID=3821 RepID=A0A151RPT1_CAJCA|nr:agamous-like MADS-box protein AGL80 [Cajanus cajan]KYP44519.1 Agamous-like MADS-box protein AGL80 [Cajanus cajan]
MPKTKVKLAFITNDAARKATYKQRKKGILKKIEELSTYCGIESCAIIYGPFVEAPEIWPSESGVQNVLGKFRTMTEWEQNRKMLDQEGFIEQNIVKGREKVKKLAKENKEKEMNMLMHQCLKSGKIDPDNYMMATDFVNLSAVIDKKLKEINRKLETLNVNEMPPHQPKMQATTNHPHPQTEATSKQHQTQEPTQTVKPEEMTPLNYDQEPDLIPNPMQRQLLMENFIIGNEKETSLPPFRDAKVPL